MSTEITWHCFDCGKNSNERTIYHDLKRGLKLNCCKACFQKRCPNPKVEERKITKREWIAEFMHIHYENASRHVGWKTQVRCQVPFDELPAENISAMLIVAGRVLEELGIDPDEEAFK